MGTEWRKTSCVLCAQNCGLEVNVENNRMVKARPDKDNPRSQGYVCRKGLNVMHHHHNDDRLSYPLKRVNGEFQRISWDQAIDEIAGKLRAIIDAHGPRSFAYMGGGGQGCHFEAAFGVRLLRNLGSQYHYSALAQELTGLFWGWGKLTGKQYLYGIPDHDRCDVLVGMGWNGMQSHQMPQARRFLTQFVKEPGKTLIVIDPRKSETARIAHIHLPIRPGTDALLTKAMIAIVLEEKLYDEKYIDQHVTGFDRVKSWFEGFNAREAVRVCELDFEKVREVCRLIATRKSAMHPDLGVYMNRHSTATTSLGGVLLAICGRIGTPGGNVIPGVVMPIGRHTDENDPKNWRTVATNFPGIMGTYPPNVMPEEILSDHPQRLRAVLCSGSNPLRSYADTSAYEKAFNRLDLLVTCEIAMTETAVLSHYVLPSRSAYESWDASFFAWNFPEIYFQMRHPVVEPEGERLELAQMMTRLADRLGMLPKIPDELVRAAKQDRKAFAGALMNFAMTEPAAMRNMPFILAKTLGEELGSANLAALWGMLQTAPPDFRECAAREGFPAGPELGERMFEALMEHPEGLWVGKCDPAKNLDAIQTPDKRLHIDFPEIEDWIKSITPESERIALESDSKWPLILMAGRHIDTNANTLMRDPSWNEGKRACTLAMHPEDAEALGLADGQQVKVITEAGEERIELEVTEGTRKGQVLIPHGFGLKYQGVIHGANVNRLTKNTHRDKFAATPLHRYVPCRVEGI